MSRWEGFKRGCGKITGASILRWCWPLPSFGWETLAFADRLKLIAFFFQVGAGIAMTGFATWAMYELAVLKATWPVFYLGAMGLGIVIIVITGLAGLLIRRSVNVEVGPFKFSAQDAGTAKELMSQLPSTTTETVVTPEGQSDVTTTTVTPHNGSA